MSEFLVMGDEKRIRELRDNIYGPGSDNNWEACKHHWMTFEGVRFLRDHQPKKDK
jgi:hypothetical protein